MTLFNQSVAVYVTIVLSRYRYINLLFTDRLQHKHTDIQRETECNRTIKKNTSYCNNKLLFVRSLTSWTFSLHYVTITMSCNDVELFRVAEYKAAKPLLYMVYRNRNRKQLHPVQVISNSVVSMVIKLYRSLDVTCRHEAVCACTEVQ